MNEQQKLKKATYHLYTFLISKMVGSLGAGVYSFGMSLYILSKTGSSLSFALNVILSFIPRIIISPIVGILSDRISRKKLVLGGQAGVILTVSALLLYTHEFGLSLAAVYTATVFNSIFSSFSSVAFSASIANLVDEARLQKAMSFNQLSSSVAGIGGPIVGGMLFGFVSMEVFLAVFIFAALVTFTLEATMNFNLFKKESPTNDVQKQETMFESFKAGFRYVNTQPTLKAILWLALWLNLFFMSVSVGGSYILVTVLKIDPTQIGFIEAGGAIGMLLTSIYFASRKQIQFPLVIVKRSTFATATVVMLIGLPVLFPLPMIWNFVYYFVIMVLFGTLGVITNTPLGVMFQTTITEEYRGRVFGIIEMMSMSAMPIGTLGYGVLFDLIPAYYILFASGLILMALVLLLLRPSILEMAHPELKQTEGKVVTE
ncbi:MFS transporter [Solibacillus sp.]|uniref:MFS transporter n=1 Tax=Solibacillus sp. TaxID=1909654 RepID=UPI003314704A